MIVRITQMDPLPKAYLKGQEIGYSGGTFTTIDGELVFTFSDTAGGSLTLPAGYTALGDYLVVGGGGSGADGRARTGSSRKVYGYGGSGGDVESDTNVEFPEGMYTVAVGKGGDPVQGTYSSHTTGLKGGDSSLALSIGSGFTKVTGLGGAGGSDAAASQSDARNGSAGDNSGQYGDITGTTIIYGAAGAKASSSGTPDPGQYGGGGQGGYGNESYDTNKSGAGGDGVVVVRLKDLYQIVDRTATVAVGENITLSDIAGTVTSVVSKDPMTAAITSSGSGVTITGGSRGTAVVEARMDSTSTTPGVIYRYTVTVTADPINITLCEGDVVKFNYDMGDSENAATYAQYQVYGNGATVGAAVAPQGATSGNYSRSACLTIEAKKTGTQQVELQVLHSGGSYATYETINVTVLPARLYQVGETGDFTCIASSFLSGQGDANWTALTQSPAGIVTASYSAQSATAAGVHFVGAANGTTVVTAKNVTGSNGNLKGVEYGLKAAVIAPHEVTLAEGDNVKIWYNNTAQKNWSLILNGTTYAAGVAGEGNGFNAVVKTGSEGGVTAQQAYIDITAKGASATSDLIIVTDGENYYAYRMTCTEPRVIKVGDTAEVTCRTVSTFDWQAQPSEGSEDYLSATCPPHDSGDTHGSTVTITGLEPTGDTPAYVNMHNEHFDATEVNAQGAIYKLACRVVGGPIIQVHISAGAFIWTANGYWAGTNATYTVTVGDWSGAKPADKSQAGYNRYNADAFTWTWHDDGASGKTVKLELNAKPGATKGDYAVFTVWAGDEKAVTYLVNVTTTFENMIAVGETADGFLYGSTEPWVSQSSAPEICRTEPTLYHNLYSSKAVPLRAGDVIICSTNPVTKADYWGILMKCYEKHERVVRVAPDTSLDVQLPTNVYEPALAAPWHIETEPSGKVTASLTSGTEQNATGATVHLTAGSAEGTDTVVVRNTYYLETVKVIVADPNKEVVSIADKIQIQVGATTNLVLDGVSGDWTALSENADIAVAAQQGEATVPVSVTGYAAGETTVTVSTADKLFILDVEVVRKTGDLPQLVLWIDEKGKGEQRMIANLNGQVAEGMSTAVTKVSTDDNMIVDAMAMSGGYALMAKQEGVTWLHVQTADTEYLQEVVVKLNHIDKRGIKLVVGKNGTKSTLSETFYSVTSFSNTSDRVSVSQLGNMITITPTGGTGLDEVFVECYQADYPTFPVTIHYFIEVEQMSQDEIREYDQGYIAYRGVSDIYEDGNDLVLVFTNIAQGGQFSIPEGLTARINMFAVGGGGAGGSVYGGLGTGGAGGGGAGGYAVVTNKKFQSGSFGIAVGQGGQSYNPAFTGQSMAGNIGLDSYLTNQFGYVFLMANGGGGGAAPSSSDYLGVPGGSGGGGAWNNTVAGAGGKGTDGQGSNGGTPEEFRCGAGGGGAGGNGGADQTGGAGVVNSYSGVETTYATGGNGGRHDIVAVGEPGSGYGDGGDGGSCAQGGDGSDGIVVVRLTRLFKNILVPIPTTNDFITTLRTEWTNNVDVVPFPYEERQFRSPTDMVQRYWTEAIEKVTGSNSVHCAYGGDEGTNKVGVGYYSFNVYLKDGFAWDDGTQYGSTDFMRYYWVITEDINNVDAHISVSKTIIWEDGSPNAIVRVDTETSPEMSGVKTPNVLFLGTLCNGHGMDVNVVTESLKTIVSVANVDYFLYSASSGTTTDSPSASGHYNVGETGNVKVNVSFNAPRHYALTVFYKRLYTQLIAEATKKQYDYIVFEFDGSRISDGYTTTYANEASVSAELKKYYDSGSVIWIVDDCNATTKEPYRNDYWRPNTYWYNNYNNNMAITQYRGLVGLFDPANYVENGTFAQISTDNKEWDVSWNTSYGGVNRDTVYANDRWDLQATYNNVSAVTALLKSVIKVKPYDIAFSDKIMSPASGLTITSVTVQGCTNEVNGAASTASADWYDIITWEPGDPATATEEGYYGTSTPHPENFQTLGFTNAVMMVTTNNEVFVDMSNCTARVWTRFDTHVHDDGTFCTSENAEYNQQTGKFEKNPNDGRAKVGVTMGGGQQGMDIDGDAETSIPWRYTAYEVRGHVNENRGGEVFVGGTRYTELSYKEGQDVPVYYRAWGGWRLTALRVDTTDHNSADELAEHATCWTFEDIDDDHDVYVTFTRYYGETVSEPVTNVYDGAAHVYPVELVDWEPIYKTEVRYSTSPYADEDEWLPAEEFIEANSANRSETCVGEHTYWYRIFAWQPGYGSTFNDDGWVWVDTGMNGSDTVTITARPLVFTADSFKLAADEAPEVQGLKFEEGNVNWHGYTMEGLIEGDTVYTNGNIVIDCPTYEKAIGQYALNPTNATGKTNADIDPSGNYSIEFRPGVLSVIKIPMVIGDVTQFSGLDPEDPLVDTGVDRVEKTYDGDPTNLTVRVDVPGDPSDFRILYSTNGVDWTDEPYVFTHAGENKVWYAVESGENWDDSLYFYVTNYNYVIIHPAEIELTSATATKPYDGTALTRNEVELTGGEMADGDELTFAATGSQTDVGSCANEFTFGIVSADGTDGSGDYTVTKKEGTLTVTNARIVIDGTEHPDTPDPKQSRSYGDTGVQDVVTLYDGTGTNITVKVDAPIAGAVIHYTTTPKDLESWTTDLEFTEVGEYIVYFAVDAANYASVTNFAKVTILPVPVTVTADDKYILVDAPQPEYTATIGDLVLRDRGREAELISYPTPTCPSYVNAEGEYEISFPGVTGVVTQGNYVVSFVPGTLYVDALPRVGSLWITDHENLDDGNVYLAFKPTLSSGELTAENVLGLASEGKIKVAWALTEEALKSAVPTVVPLRDPTGELDLDKGWIWVQVPVDLETLESGKPILWAITIDR